MKHNNINKIFLLTSILALTGCSSAISSEAGQLNATGEATITASQILALLNGDVTVKGQATERTDYPEDYSFLSSTTTYTINRDYATLTNSNGRKVKMVKELDTGEIFFEDSSGILKKEYLTTTNTVSSYAVQSLFSDQLFSEVYSNPWDYIDSDDIFEDYSLSTVKACLVLEDYFGVSRNVESAKFVIENNQVTGLDFVVSDRPDGATDSSGNIISIPSIMEADLNFDFG
ncbi:MAG: hypothetical protein WCR67_02160 [Bacilli bacterium]